MSELSYEELVEVNIYSRNKIFDKLFKIYGTSKCSEEDYMKVYDYMCNESIEKLMLSKLSSEELQYAKKETIRLSEILKEQLNDKVNEEQKPERYEQLSMVDSYILHIISNIDYARSVYSFNRKIELQLEQNDIMRQKNLNYASNPYIRK